MGRAASRGRETFPARLHTDAELAVRKLLLNQQKTLPKKEFFISIVREQEKSYSIMILRFRS